MFIKQKISIDEIVYQEPKQFSIIVKDNSNIRCRDLDKYIVIASTGTNTYILSSDEALSYCEEWLLGMNNRIIEPLYEVYIEGKNWKVREI